MTQPPLRRLMVALALLAASIVAGHAALPGADSPPETATLTGKLLVAEPEIGDPRFRHTVILLVRHDEHGAFGLIINRPIGSRPWADLLGSVGEDSAGVDGDVPVFFGGPVEPEAGFVLHSPDYNGPGTLPIDDLAALSGSPEILRDIARHDGPRKSLIAFGYAGWAPGQLEHELALHGWFTIPDDQKLLFDDDRDKVWDEATARRAIAL
jgi:putative transcriptional regulator